MTEVRGHVFPKWGPRGPFRVYTWTQVVLTGVGVAFSALLLVAGAGGPAAVLLVLLGGLALRDGTGMPAWSRAGTGLRFLVAGWTRRRQFGASNPDERPSWLAGVEVSVVDLPQGRLGVAVDRGRFLAAMRVSPLRDPWLTSEADREVAADDWARLVSSLPAETVDRIQVLTVTRQGGGDALVADADRASGPGLEVIKDVAHTLAAEVHTSDTILVVRLAQKAGRDVAKRGGMPAVGQTLYATLQQYGAQLPTDQVAAEILAPGDWHYLFELILGSGLDVESVEERWGSVRVGDHSHQVWWMWQWPQRPMASGFLAPLIAGAGSRVVSLVIEPTDPEPHQRALDWAYRRAEAALATATASKHRKQADLDSLDRQLTELNQGHIPVRALLAVSVTTADPGELEDLAGMARSSAVAGSGRLALAGGRQGRALGVTLPLCRGLDKGVDW